MASLNKAIRKEFFNSILPVFGQPKASVPIWNEGQKMFICDQYESVNGNRYYKGVRFCDKIVVVEKLGMYHSWTYIDSIEIYAFNEKRLELVQKRDYDKVHRSDEFVRNETKGLLCDYLCATMKLNKCNFPKEEVEIEAKTIVDSCYESFLDGRYNTQLMQILPQLK
ncbi:MAG: hypothetical protein IJY44_05850 [Bacteroidaceae bacterium]|nr:hypothetical protein [Bacteroidaceae bacterium]